MQDRRPHSYIARPIAIRISRLARVLVTLRTLLGLAVVAAGIVALRVGVRALWLALDPDTASAASACGNGDERPRKLTRRQTKDSVACLVERRRKAAGSSGLSVRSEANQAANRHSRRMLKSGCFSHRCPGETDMAGRMHSTSYLPCNCSWRLGETIGFGEGKRGSPRWIVSRWMQSSVHRQAILTGGFEHIGVGVVCGRPGKANSKSAPSTVVLAAKN